jgi:capsular polysaccharide biosynthesis protein
MELRRYAAILWRRKVLILAIVGLTLAAVWTSGELEPDGARYRATATLLVSVPPGQSVSYPPEAIRSLTVAREVVRATGVSATPDSLLDGLRITPRPGSSLVDVQVEDADPERAARLANGFAHAYLEGVAAMGGPDPQALDGLLSAHQDLRERAVQIAGSRLDPTRRDWELRWLQVRDERLAQAYADLLLRELLADPTGVEARLLDPARPPSGPVESPFAQQARTLGGIGGVALLAAITLAFLLEYLDDRLRTGTDVEALTGLPVLATLPSRARIRRAARRFAAARRRERGVET